MIIGAFESAETVCKSNLAAARRAHCVPQRAHSRVALRANGIDRRTVLQVPRRCARIYSIDEVNPEGTGPRTGTAARHRNARANGERRDSAVQCSTLVLQTRAEN